MLLTSSGNRGAHMPNSVDKQVGRRILETREARGLTVEQLGDHIGILGTRVQAIEAGDERAGAALLFKIAAALNVPISTFFE
jgi:transcriptional regulator with XRE-family HTH domain